ncbi:sacsin-like isoform X2 [Tubulanus polymorphus]|uniref:sacsin-like isoform X2 n=1 Tax=Tubulanus polymorphus TaxID=672921 RepID=UPI003DA2EEA2
MDHIDVDDDDEFGIKQPTLVESLKRILDEYPDDGQILKELIQNAEDASASTIQFLYDEQSYTEENLRFPGMAEFNQNPSLVIYNDGIFTQRDWNTIGNLGISKKKEDPIKVGKFGLGFKSVFHITDCPMIVSGNIFGIIDPHLKYFKDKSGKLLSGFKWTLSTEDVPTGLLAPFIDKFGFKGDTLKGTIFRFPLRQKPSPLSETIYTMDKVNSLLQGLTYNMYMKVLFLTNVNQIEIYRQNNGLQYRSAVVICTEKVIENFRFDGVTTCPTREKFKQGLSDMMEISGVWACVTRLNIETEKFIDKDHSEKEQHSFVISHFCDKTDINLEKLAKKQGNMPWVSCALDLNKENYQPDGHVFVFLPLPMEGKSLTGLPVHVNGCYAVSQNRRHLKWPSDEQLQNASSSKDAKDLEWNVRILSELLPIAYLNALKVCGSIGSICKYLPNPKDVDEKWKRLILEPFFSKLLNQELFQTTVRNEKGVVPLMDACLLVQEKNDTDEMMTIVSNVLTSADYSVVHVPEYVEMAVRIYTGHHLLVVTPDVVRQAMKKETLSYQNRSDAEKGQLLEYILRDSCFSELKGIALLPLENGEYTEFQTPKLKNIIYAEDKDNPLCLLPGITDCFLRKCIPENMKIKLVDAGKQGHIQLRGLNSDGVVDLLPRVLYWNNDHCSKDELLVCGHKTQITCEWYTNIWCYIVEKMHGEISRISHLHLIMVEINADTHEWKLGCLKTKNSYVIQHHSTAQQLSTNICSVLKAIGMIVIPELMDEILRCPDILESGDYLYKPTADGIVQAIYKLYKTDTFFMTNVTDLPRNVDTDSLNALRTFIAAGDLSATPKKKLKCLQFIPIFNQVGNSSEWIAFRGADKVLISCNLPVDLPNIKHAIDARDKDSATVVSLFSGDILHECEILVRFIFPDIHNGKMEQNEVNKLMEYILQHKHKYASENTEFIEYLKQLPFIRTSSGNFCVSELFDFSDSCLISVFEENQFPPRERWQKHCGELREIGLKGRKDVKMSDIVQAVKNLVVRKNPQTAFNHINELLQLQKKESMTRNDYATLREMAWLLPLGRPTSYPDSLKWKNDTTNKFIKPSEAMNSKCANAVGGVINVVDIDKHVASLFNVADSPTLPQLVSQLKEVSKSYTTREKRQYLVLVHRIYEEFQRYECETLKRELQKQNIEDWIWHGDGFIALHRVSIIEPDIFVRPYFHHLPPEMLQYKTWWIALGIAERINYCSVLHQIKQYLDSDQGKLVDTCDRDLNMVINILNHYYTAKVDIRNEAIFLPVLINEKVRLVPPEKSTICTSVLEQMNMNNEVGEEVKFVHPHLSEKVAESLGAYPMMKRLVNDADDFGSEGWGQQETLVRRLKNIISDYTDGFALPKELIQNADDAGATEVKFLWDERENEQYMTKLLHEEMRHCQGPALWAYNNAVFTKHDLLNIKKLGGATKESDPVKIGRFGLGFNSVYNLTDVPSFISEENLVIFDPHSTYLNIQGQPGILIDLKKNPMIFHRAPDQIAPFQCVFGCELSMENCKFNGTLFRLPLRTQYQASKSEICEVVYKRQRMEELLKVMRDGANITLLFTQHVKKVSVYHLKEDSTCPSEMVELFSAEKSFVLEEKPLRHRISVNSSETDDKLLKASMVNAAAKLCCDAEQSFEAGYILEMALKIKENCSKEKWLITSYSSNKQTTLTRAKELKTLPLGMVAIQLIDFFIPTPIKGYTFCHLPLPINSGLPFHINGCFAVASNRKSLEIMTQDDIANRRADWNNELLADSVLQAFLYGLEVLKRNNAYESILTLFPVREKIADTSQRLCGAFYAHITSSSSLVFYDGEKWRTFNEVQFLSEELLDCELVDDVTNVLNSYLSGRDQVIIKLPVNIIAEMSLTNEKIEKKVLEKTWTILSFMKLLLPNVLKIKPAARYRLLRYGLRLIETDPKVKELLSSTECFPVNGSSILRKPADLVDPRGKCGMLYDEDDERFPHDEFKEDVSRRALLHLKMIGDILPTNNVIDRAKSIKRLDFEYGKRRMNSFLNHLQTIIPSGQLPKAWCNVKKKLIHIEFLLVKDRPANWNELPWKGDELRSVFKKPAAIYSYKHLDLIGSIHPVTCSALPNRVTHFLEVDEKTPSIVDVFQQLEHYQQLQGISPENEKRIKNLYQFLNKKATGNEKILRKYLTHVLVDYKFMPIVHLALNFRMSTCLPYLARVPCYFRDHNHLLVICNIRPRFTCEDYIEALARMKSAGETNIQDILELINSLCFCMKSENKYATDSESKYIYLVDATNKWKSAKDLSFNITPWFDATAGQNFAHPKITFHDAKRLGVMTSVECYLESNSKDLFGGISFGQKEKLTTRLKRLIKGYPQETIINELLQNADDAGATEIHLILDTNTYAAERVIGEQYRDLQGPALLVYNNRPFSEGDLKGIQNLGEGSKGVDPTTTGRYGVGFNCVYSLTDTPQILSDVDKIGKVLCIFDPNCKYVPLANESSPGKRYPVTDKFSSQFPDLFEPFNLTYLPIEGNTIFRFPLRTANMALKSDICSEAMTPAHIQGLLSSFAAESKNAMLFLKSIKRISISLKTEMKQALLLHSISSEISESHRKGISALNIETKKMSECIYKIGDTTAIYCQFYEIHEVQLVDNEGKAETWMVSQVIGTGTKSFEECVQFAVNEKKLRLLPCAGVACRIDFNQSAMNTGRMYCFLPLPVKIPMPFHINGHFALDETRRALWSDMNVSYRTVWNNLIMHHVAPVAHCLLVEHMQKMIVNNETYNEQLLCTMIPEKDESDAYLHTFIKSLYGQFKQRNSKIFITHDSRWFSVSDLVNSRAFFDDLEGSIIQRALIAVEFPLIKLPSLRHRELLIDLGYQVKTVTPQFVLEFFRSYRPSTTKLSETPLEKEINVISILQYCLGLGESFVAQLDGVCLCVTTGGHLIPFESGKPIFYSDYCDLLPSTECLFLSTRVRDFLCKYIDLHCCPVVKPFTLDELAKLIHMVLPQSQYKNAVIPVEHFIEEKWLKRLWEFVTEQISVIVADLDRPFDEQCQKVIGRVNCLSDWSLLPVITQSGKALYPIKWAEHVLNLHRSDSYPVKKLIEQFRLPTLNESFFGKVKVHAQTSVFTILDKMTCSLMYPGHVLAALTWHLDANAGIERFAHTAIASWSYSQFQTMLQYFASFFASGKASTKDAACIGRLPIHETGQGNRVQLQASGVYVIPRVFRVMHTNDDLLHESFVQHEWISFVKKIGLRCSVSQEELLTYAKTIECHGRTVLLVAGPGHLYKEDIDSRYSVKDKAKAIVENIFARDDLSEQTIDELKEIKFIPINYGIMWKLCPQTDPKSLISFSGSVAYINMPLCWSCMNVLPVWATPKNTMSTTLGVHKNPPQSMILAHCKNMCQHLADGNKHEVCSRYSKELERIMMDIYCHLEGYENLEQLKHVQCVFMGGDSNYFVYPRQVVINISEKDQIIPYLLRRPVYCASFESLLKKIGVSEDVTMLHYANVLTDIETLYGDKVLNDNDFNRAIKASVQFYELIHVEYNYENRTDNTKNDYTLLINGATLRKSSQIYYIDGPRYRRRMEEVKENMLLDKYRNNNRREIIIHELDTTMLARISYLQPISTLLIEELSERSHENMYPARRQPFISIQQKMLDPNFHEAIYQVIRHLTEPQQATCITLDEISMYYQQISIFECQPLETVLKCRGKIISNSEDRVDSFRSVDSQAAGPINMYFTPMEDDQSYVTICMKMKKIANMFSNHFATKYIGVKMLDRFHGCLFEIVFAGPETSLVGIFNRWNIDIDDQFDNVDTLPSAGSFIPLANHHLLSNRFALFHADDYVGYKTHDDILVNENSDSGAVYIYGKIIRRVGDEESVSSGEVSRSFHHCYKVNLGDRIAEIYGYELYKFLRYDDEEKYLVDPDELEMSPIDAEKEIDQLLKTAWTLDHSQRNKIILRLVAYYSNDETILGYVKNQNQLEEENYEHRVCDEESGSNYIDYKNLDIDLATSFLRVRQDQHRNDRKRNLRDLQDNSTRRGRRTFVPCMIITGRNPQPAEARKWLKQAEITLKTVPNDVSGGFHFMTIYKCHLTCEQALTAMVLARDSSEYNPRETRHNLDLLTGKIDDCSTEICKLATKLQRDVCRNRNRLLYPNRLDGAEIPHTAYSQMDSTDAQLIVTELVKLAREYIINSL